MRYQPAVELTDLVERLLSVGALRLQPGQWVRKGDRYGRFLRTNAKTGVSYVTWVRPDDDWSRQAQRFHRACLKGYVGKYERFYRPRRRPGSKIAMPSR